MEKSLFFVCFISNGNHHSNKPYKLDAQRASKEAVDKGTQEKPHTQKERSEVKPHPIFIPEILRDVLKSLLLAHPKPILNLLLTSPGSEFYSRPQNKSKTPLQELLQFYEEYRFKQRFLA